MEKMVFYLSGSTRNTSCSVIRNCSFYNNNNTGIHLERLSDNIIENCVFDHNALGIYLDRSNSNNIRNCSFYSNREEGVQISGIFWLVSIPWDNEISYCDFINNSIGIMLLETRRTNIHHCTIANNSYMGVTSVFSVVEITSNNFFNNGRNSSGMVDSAGVYSWCSFFDGRNNWWGSPQGPSVSLLLRFNHTGKIVPLRMIDYSDVIMLRYGFVRFRPWFSEPVSTAGRQI